MMRKRRQHAITIALAAFLTAFSLGSISALAMQRITQTGQALDANLLVGSGGYNRPVRSSGAVNRQHYSVGSSRSLYTVSRNGEMVYSPHNAFTPRQRYHATGYTGDFQTSSYHRRFRYTGY